MRMCLLIISPDSESEAFCFQVYCRLGFSYSQCGCCRCGSHHAAGDGSKCTPIKSQAHAWFVLFLAFMVFAVLVTMHQLSVVIEDDYRYMSSLLLQDSLLYCVKTADPSTTPIRLPHLLYDEGAARRRTSRLTASLGSMMDLQALCWLGRPPRLGWAAADGSDYQTCCYRDYARPARGPPRPGSPGWPDDSDGRTSRLAAAPLDWLPRPDRR
jgi:hypothetical protein